jgi:hypothetical protein
MSSGSRRREANKKAEMRKLTLLSKMEKAKGCLMEK